jgi:dTDP-4-dehydrorhamnose reductase
LSEARRILIVGASGQVGTELQRSFAGAGEVIAAKREKADMTSEDQVRNLVQSTQPDVILNASAYTAVDRAESDAETAMTVNATAPRWLAEEALRRDILLVHYSTDYVFDGSKEGPWVETDSPNPLGVYGATKLAGEQAIAQVGGRYLIFRTSWVYGPHGKNFLLTMLRLGRERGRLSIVDDQFGAPTTSLAIAEATRKIVDSVLAGSAGPVNEWAGIYHMTCGESTTWCGFAKAIFARVPLPGDRKPEITGIPASEYPTPAKRPLNSVLSNEKLHSRFGVRLPDWATALDTVTQQL